MRHADRRGAALDGGATALPCQGCGVPAAAEIEALERLVAARAIPRPQRHMLADEPLQTAMLGGCLARERDPPPGNMAVWRGLTRLQDIAAGTTIGSDQRCGVIEDPAGGMPPGPVMGRCVPMRTEDHGVPSKDGSSPEPARASSEASL